MSDSDSSRNIKSTKRTFDILEQIREQGGATLTNIANKQEVSKSTVHAYLSTLDKMGYVRREDNVYDITLRFLSLGGYVLQGETHGKLYREAKNELDELAQKCGERAKMMVPEQEIGVLLYQADGPQSIKTDAHIGMTVPLHSTALGKAFLSEIGEQQVHEILDEHGLPELTENTISDREDLLEELEEVRERGVAFDRGERTSGVYCTAAPVKTDGGDILGSVSVSVPKKRADEERFSKKLTEMVINSARVIGLNTTYR